MEKRYLKEVRVIDNKLRSFVVPPGSKWSRSYVPGRWHKGRNGSGLFVFDVTDDLYALPVCSYVDSQVWECDVKEEIPITYITGCFDWDELMEEFWASPKAFQPGNHACFNMHPAARIFTAIKLTKRVR